ncbi:hypothetical protein ACFWF7_15380 [Nocardia sp. NPDC060256]|uniref:hypothetical protein n=1 Tax=unclassified Nocardia TaxID=2637762 RepID=UPI003652D636
MTMSSLDLSRFEIVGESEADSRGRVALGRAGARPGRRYQIRINSDGVVVLVPVVSILEREMMVWENPHLAAEIRQGVKDAESGDTVDLGDFTQFATDPEDKA